jgi:hypothetical protein
MNPALGHAEEESMKRLKFLVLLFFFCAAIGCSREDTPISGAEKRSIEAEVQTALDSLLAAWSSLDVRAVNRHYSDASIDTYNGERSEPRDWADSDYDGLSKTEIQPFEDLRFDVLARNAVVVSWENTFVETDAGGQRQPEMLALMTQVWVRDDEGWEILHSHESTRPTSGGR